MTEDVAANTAPRSVTAAEKKAREEENGAAFQLLEAVENATSNAIVLDASELARLHSLSTFHGLDLSL